MSQRSNKLPLPRRWPWRHCGRHTNYKCPEISKATNKQGIPLAGNINMPGNMLVYGGRGGHKYSATIRHAFDVSRRGSNCNGPPKTSYLSHPVNIFGRWEGAPGGSGSPPRNNF